MGKRRSRAAWLAWSVWTRCGALVASVLLLDLFATHVSVKGVLNSDVLIAAALMAYPTVGAIVASRHPNNLVGWLLCAIGFIVGIHGFAKAYADYALVAQPGSLPGGTYMACLSDGWFGLTGIFLVPALLILLFPNGRLPTSSWRVVVWLAVGGSVLAALWFATEHATLEPYQSVRNPF